VVLVAVAVGYLRIIRAEKAELDARRAYQSLRERERLARRLRQSQRLESLGRLSGAVAHDFNNLLGVIVNYAAFVREQVQQAGHDGGASRDQLERDIDGIVQAAAQASRLTRQLLVFARGDGRQGLPVDAGEAIRGIEELLRRTLGARIELRVDIDTDLEPVAIDPGQLEQVLVNLVDNARDAMPSGGTVTIAASSFPVAQKPAAWQPPVEPGRYVRLRVSDTGTGMDGAIAEHAPEPFFSTKPDAQAAGLGLATVYGIVTDAGGRVQIDSEPGRGTTVSLLLPAAEEIAWEASAALPEPALRGEESVLLVEDGAPLREVMVRMLERSGYRVRAAATGEEALELARAPDLDVLVTDIVMPGMLGNELAERVAALHPGVRVLYISGYAEPMLRAHGGPWGSAPLLEKPFTELALLARLRELLDDAELGERPARP
jgi:signal transduction histidine kinase/CheY-like chemotaxis protein